MNYLRCIDGPKEGEWLEDTGICQQFMLFPKSIILLGKGEISAIPDALILTYEKQTIGNTLVYALSDTSREKLAEWKANQHAEAD